MFYEINRTASVDDTFVSSATMRAHVRAIDDSEDDLLDIYRDAAVDYLQNLSDRVLGLSTAKVLLDYSEFRAPFRIQKLQDITAVNKLEYLKDGEYIKHVPTIPADEIHSHHTIVSVSFTNGTAINKIVEVDTAETNVHVDISAVDTEVPTLAVFTLEKLNHHSGSYVQVDTGPVGAVDQQHEFRDVGAGLYRIRYKTTNSNNHIDSSFYYFAINNGTLFKNKMLFDQYPARFDFSELCNLVEYDEDMDAPFLMEVKCGTALASLPHQYVQAGLLLIGHYYNMREAEAIGGITTEVKEGVHRLVASVRQY